MDERLTKIKDDAKAFWQSRSKRQKGVMIGGVVSVILLAAIITFYATRTNFCTKQSHCLQWPYFFGGIIENI